MSRSTRTSSAILRIVCFVLLLAFALLQMRYALHQQLMFVGGGDESTILHSRNATQLTNLAREKHLFEADLEQASLLLQKALSASPLYVPAWLALAVVRNDQGESAQSIQILAYAHHLTSSIKRWRWDTVLTAYELGQTALLPVELSYIVGEIPGKTRRSALQLAFSVWPDPADLVNNLGQENLPHLFNQAYASKDVPKTLYFYQAMTNTGETIARRHLLAAIDMLLGNDEAVSAGDIWRREFSPKALIYNGDFSSPLVNTAFGWRRKKQSSTAVSIEGVRGVPGKHALHVRFKGWDNVDYHHLYQLTPLVPGTSYRFEAKVKSDSLTTDQRPFFEIYGFQCADFPRTQTEMIPASTDWRILTHNFLVPEHCSTAIVRLRRQQSDLIDSKISGNLWITDVTLTEQDAHQD
jgi:hypothetical protein